MNEINSEASSVSVVWVIMIWIVLSCLFGWILSSFIDPPDVIWLMYLEYADMIYYYYGLFCLSMLSCFILMPLALFFSWSALWSSIGVPHRPSKSRIFILFMLIPVTLIPGLGFLYFDDDEKSIIHLILVFLTFLFDWIGGVIFAISFSFIILFYLIAVIAKAISTLKHEKTIATDHENN